MPLIINFLRRWLILSIVVPLGAAVARRIARSIERKKGRSTALSRGLGKAADTASRKKRGRGHR